MAEAKIEYVQKEGPFEIGDFVQITKIAQGSEDPDAPSERDAVHAVIVAEGTDRMNNPVEGHWNLEIPGWDSLHGKVDEKSNKPVGGHIYNVRPLACAVPEDDFIHAPIPKYMFVSTDGPKKSRIMGAYEYGNKVEKRPAWYMTHKDGTKLVLCHKKQKGKPAWLITRTQVLEKNQDGGYALFAQDLWLPSHTHKHLRGEVWGTWDTTSGKWVADQSLTITAGKEQ